MLSTLCRVARKDQRNRSLVLCSKATCFADSLYKTYELFTSSRDFEIHGSNQSSLCWRFQFKPIDKPHSVVFLINITALQACSFMQQLRGEYVAPKPPLIRTKLAFSFLFSHAGSQKMPIHDMVVVYSGLPA